MVRLTADRPGKITFNAVLTTPHQDALVDTDGECVTLSGVSSWHEGLKGKVEFQGRLATRVQGGAVSCRDGVLTVEGADEAVVYVSLATNFINYKDISADQVERARQYLEKAMQKNYTEQSSLISIFSKRIWIVSV